MSFNKNIMSLNLSCYYMGGGGGVTVSSKKSWLPCKTPNSLSGRHQTSCHAVATN